MLMALRRDQARKIASRPDGERLQCLLFASVVLGIVLFAGLGYAAAPALDPLTPEERAWLRAHEPLRYVPHTFSPPLEFRGASNSLGGITPELLSLMATNLDLRFKKIFANDSPLEAIAQGRADFAGAWAETSARAERFRFTRPYLWVSNVFFVQRDSPYKRALDLSERKVGVVQGTSAHEWLEKQASRYQVVPVMSTREGLLLLSVGHLDAMIETKLTGERICASSGLSNLRHLPGFPFASPQQFVVAKENELLQAILQKGLDSVPEAERARLIAKWSTPENGSSPNTIPEWLWQSMYALVAAGLGLGLWIITLRRQVERRTREMRQNRALLHSVIEGTDDAIFVKDWRGRYLLFNGAAGRMTGKQPETVIGNDDTFIFSPPEAQSIMVHDRQVMDQDEVKTFDEMVTMADGQTHSMLVTKGPLRDDCGRVTGIFGISRDVTDRHRAADEIRSLNARLESRLVALTQPLGDLSNVRFEDLFDLREIQHIQDAFAAATGVASIITDTEGQPLTRPSNFCRLCEHIIRKTEKGLRNCIHSDAVLGRKHEGGPIIQRCLSGGLWDAGTSICVGDRHIANWLIGQVLDESVDESVLLSYAREIGADPAEVTQAYREVTRMPRSQFEKVCVALHVIAGQLSRQAVQNVQQARFITEQKMAEETRAQLEAQLRHAQKMEAVGQLAGGVAHDFNNILAALLLNLNLLQQETGCSPELQSGLAEMESLAQRATALTRQLLLFGRRQVMQKRVLDLNSLLGNLLKMLSRLVGEHISLDFQGGQKALWIQADPSMMEQVITNLVVNARDALSQGGRISLRAQAVSIEAGHVEVHPQARLGEFVSLSVCDTGSGMDELTLKRIFEPFFTTKEVGKGTGLGLSTVYSIVDQHAGWIEVESARGQGSTFHVYLPACETPAPDEENIPSRATMLRGTETILVVEDESAVRQITVRTLKHHGYHVLEAANGQEALLHWKKRGESVNLLLTDMVMPGSLSGFELVEQLRKTQPGLRAILMSGYSPEMMMRDFTAPGDAAFLQKPFATADLLGKVRELLDGRSPEATSAVTPALQ